jgi:hypothetical protein
MSLGLAAMLIKSYDDQVSLKSFIMNLLRIRVDGRSRRNNKQLCI